MDSDFLTWPALLREVTKIIRRYKFCWINNTSRQITRPWFHGRVMEKLRAVLRTHADHGSNFSRWQSKQLQQQRWSQQNHISDKERYKREGTEPEWKTKDLFLLPVVLAFANSRHKSHHHGSTTVYPETPRLKNIVVHKSKWWESPKS